MAKKPGGVYANLGLIHHVEAQVLVLLMIAAIVALAARRLRLPYTLALVIAGLGLGFIHLETLEDLSLTPDLLLLLFLPPLLFEAAFNLHLDEFKKNLFPILYLAVVGVGLAIIATATMLHIGIGLTGNELGWPQAFLLAAVIAATDPISVLALFKEVGAPRRLYVLIEGESLINDGVAVVAFAIVMTVIGFSTSGKPVQPVEGAGAVTSYAIITFVRMAIGGALIGGIIGGLASVVTQQIDDHQIEITLTTIVAWGSFLIAEEVHVSGVLSTVTAGIVVGSFGGKYGMSPATKVAVEDFWEYMGFLSNSFIFLLIGLELEPVRLVQDLAAIVVAFVAVVAGRALVVYGSMPIINRFADAIPSAWRHVMVWGGLRGSLSMVLVIGLPATFPGRSLLIDLVFGVVALSLFGQGLTMSKLMHKLGVGGEAVGSGRDYEMARGTALAAARVLKAAEDLRDEGVLDDRTQARLSKWYNKRLGQAQIRARRLAGEHVKPEHLLEGMRTLAAVEKERIRSAAAAEVISTNSAGQLLGEIDARMQKLEAASHVSEEELVDVINDILGGADDE